MSSRQTHKRFNFDEEWTRDSACAIRGAKSQQTAKQISMEHLFGLDDFGDISLDATKRPSYGRRTAPERRRQPLGNRPPAGNTDRSFRKFDAGFDDASTFKQKEQRDFKPSRQWASSRSHMMCSPVTQYFGVFVVDGFRKILDVRPVCTILSVVSAARRTMRWKSTCIRIRRGVRCSRSLVRSSSAPTIHELRRHRAVTVYILTRATCRVTCSSSP